MRLRPIFLALALSTSAAAEETALDPKEEATMQSFGAAHPECMEWSDGCATCARTTAVHCSTPGIACQPGEIACKAP